MIKKLKPSKHSKLPYIIGAVAVLLIVGSFYTYHLVNKKKPIPTVDQYTKGQAGQPSDTSSSSNSSNSTNQSSPLPNSSKAVGRSASLVAPTGNFVSNHHPSLSNTSTAPNSMTSVCNTTPGASCQIFFNNGGTVKSLASQVTDAGGATYWYWTLQDVGLTPGNWTVSATSSLSGRSLSSTDATTLVVSQ